ncbi:Voltage-gated Ion Channel (VIC) Superfamily [Achlya hypogyna]|uniref:Voltage-gated Ion Channel (VIC) Superfamily n=1 Tax=Achlya hypogyna TaxID=1202772 RepID=A0A1V9ZHF4_ACHHY|nr:Voltage-gated Ion Channel (VIC) Superfamily [Achlya hypogyna]
MECEEPAKKRLSMDHTKLSSVMPDGPCEEQAESDDSFQLHSRTGQLPNRTSPRTSRVSDSDKSLRGRTRRMTVEAKEWVLARSNSLRREAKTRVSVVSLAGAAFGVESLGDFQMKLHRATQSWVIRHTEHRTIDPNGTAISAWRIFLLTAILYDALVVPLMLCVANVNPSVCSVSALSNVMLVAEGCFVLDMVVNSHLGFLKDGDMIRNPQLTRRKYLRSRRCAFDLAALIPVYAFTAPASCGLVHLNKLLRLVYVSSYVVEFDKMFARHFKFCKVVKVVVVSYIFEHYMACMYFAFGFSDGSDFTAWKLGHALATEPLLTQYFGALFWSVGIISKCVEGVVPRTIIETIFMHVIMFGGFLLFVYICGTLFMMSKCDTADQEQLDAKVNQLRQVLSYHRVPRDIQDRAVEYIESGFRSGDMNDKHNMKLLCPSIAKDVKFVMLKEMVANVPFFRRCSNSFLRALIDLTETEAMPANFTVVQQGDVGEFMYFVQSGVLVITLDHIKIKELRKGTSFGELSLFTNRTRSASVVTTTFCILHKLARIHVHQVLTAYPEFENGILDCVAQLIQEFDGENSKIVDPKRRQSVLYTLKQAAEISEAAGSKPKPAKTTIIKERRPGLFKRAQTTVAPATLAAARPASPRSRAKSLPTSESEPPVVAPKPTLPRWTKLLLKKPIPRRSNFRLGWLLLVAGAMWYNVLAVTLLNSFTSLGYPVIALVLNTVADVLYVADIYGQLNLSYIVEAEQIMDPVKCARHYTKKYFYFDILCALPWWVLAPSAHLTLRCIRLCRCYHIAHEFEEITFLLRITSRRRILILGFGLFVSYHLAACITQLYVLSALHSDTDHGSSVHGNGAWMPPASLELSWNDNKTAYIAANGTVIAADDPIVVDIIARQYLRALYYGAVCVTNLGRPIEPETFGEYLVAFAFMSAGMLLISALIDEVQKRVTASALEQMEFLSTRSRIEHFLKTQRVPDAIHRRASAYLDFWWSVHRGANINVLVGELPNNLQRDIYSFICRPFLDVVARLDKIKEAFPRVSTIFLDNVHIQLFGQGEMIYRKNDLAETLYMVLEGHVTASASSRMSIGSLLQDLGPGDPFGLTALDIDNEHAVHTSNAIAMSSCAVVCISRETLAAMRQAYLPFCVKFEERAMKGQARRVEHKARKRLEAIALPQMAVDPEGTFAIAWELFLLVGIVYECVTIPFFLAFGRGETDATLAGISLVFEVGFFLDIVLKFRTGYWEHGNKVMDIKKIRRQYAFSAAFVVDVLSTLPLNLANYGDQPYVELWNINKLLRLFKLAGQLKHLERHFYTIGIQIRVVRIIFYTYLLAHYVGCAWFDFGSAHAQLGEEEFGANHWLPAIGIGSSANASVALIYAHCYHWGLGMLVGFQPGEYPETPAESVFTIVVQTLGVFLLAYVVGNLLDIACVMDGNNRMFYSNLNYVRKLLQYFEFSDEVEARVQHFYFYRLYHSIHEEHVLAKCLPPTLLADVRLFLLTPMLNKVPFFQEEHASSNITRVLVSQMSQILVTRGEVVCRQNEIGMEMFFVFSGCLDIYVAKDAAELYDTSPLGIYTFAAIAKGNKVNEIHGGSFFGEKSLFSNQPRNASIEARTFCTLFRLSRQHLESVFAQYPEWKAKVMQIVKLLYKEQVKMIQRDRVTSQAQLTDSGAMPRRLSRIRVLPAPEPKLPLHEKLVRRGSESFKTVLDVVRRRKESNSSLPWKQRLLHIEVQSPVYRTFMKLLCLSILYDVTSIPFLVTFGHQGISTPALAVAKVLNVLTDAVYVYDIWFKRHLVESAATREFYEGNILPKGSLALDVLAVVPLDYVLSPLFQWSSVFRFNRFLKLKQFNHAVHEINRFSMAYEANRLALLALYYLICVYWTACAYFGLTIVDGFGDSWVTFLPSSHFEIQANATVNLMFERVLRCLYFATTIYTGAGIVYEPATLLQYAFLNIISVFGVFALSYIIGEASSLSIYLIQNEVEFKINQMNVIEFMRHKRLDAVMESRIQAYLSYWWASQSGVQYQAILEQLPTRIRCQAVIQITRLSLTRFAMKYIRPLCLDNAGIELVIYSIAQRLVFEGYPVGESVIVQGNIGKSMYFISKGTLISASTEAGFLPSRFADGQYFGEEGFLGASVCQYSVVTLRACDLLSLSATDFLAALFEHPLFVECATIARDVVVRLASYSVQPDCALDFGDVVWAALMNHMPCLNYVKFHSIDEAVRAFDHFVKLFLSHSAAELLGTKYQKPMMCKRCDSDVAVYYCAECVQTMCMECSIKVHGSPEFANHLKTITDVTFYKKPPVVSPARRLTMSFYAPR